MKTFLLTVLVATAHCHAAPTIEVSAKFADMPAGAEVPAKPEMLAKIKGADVLSAPRVTTPSGQSATIEITQNLSAPDGSEEPLGVSLSIKPTLTEKGAIAFTGKATDRFKHGQHETESLSVLACVVRETFFKGTAANGATVVLTAGPSTATSVKKDGATTVKNRELVIYLTFKKIASEPEKKSPPKKKAEPSSSSGTKSAKKKK